MTRHEQDVATMARLFECRRTAQFLYGDGYDDALTPWRDLIRDVMARQTLPPLRAALRVAERVPVADAVPVMLLMAAALDLIESAANAGATSSVKGATASAQRSSSCR